MKPLTQSDRTRIGVRQYQNRFGGVMSSQAFRDQMGFAAPGWCGNCASVD